MKNEIFQNNCHRDIERYEHAYPGQIFKQNIKFYSRYSNLAPIICRNMAYNTAGFVLCVVMYHVNQIQEGSTGKSKYKYTPFLLLLTMLTVSFIYA